MDDVQAVLQKADGQLTMIGTLYEADLELQRASPTLRGKIKLFLENERATLDQMAGRVVAAAGAGEAHTHYPLCPEAGRFEESLGKNMPGLTEHRPDLALTISRHQPYSAPGLARLRDLLVDVTRQRLTPSTRPAPDEPAPVAPSAEEAAAPPAPPPIPSAGLGSGLTGSVYINGVQHDPITMRPLNAPTEARRETVYVDWRFEGDDVPATQRLEEVHAAVVSAVAEVSAAAGL